MNFPPYINIATDDYFRYNVTGKEDFFMKKIIFILCMLGLFSFVSSAEENYDIPICVMFNGNYVDFENEPKLISGITYLPVRFFCEALSAQVDWIDSSSTVMVTSGKDVISFDIGSSTAYINGVPTKINGQARLINNLTYLPVRFITESLGGIVNWNNEYYTVDILMPDKSLPDKLTKNREYTNDEIYWLAKIISCESEDEPINGKIAVGNVVLNRVESDKYPDTIYSVIFDKKHGYQFQPVANGSINKEPVQEAYLAAKLCLEGHNVVGECMYFLNPDKATSFWIPQNKNYYTTIGSHDFYF